METYRKIISGKIQSLSDDKKIVFALLTCEKLLPNYAFFSKAYNYGNPQLVEMIISTLFANLLNGIPVQTVDIENFITQVEEITPDTEDFDTVVVSFALDACTAVLSTLDFLKTNDPENIIYVACYARDTVDMYVQELYDLNANNPNINALIDENQFMIREKKRQIDIIIYLAAMDSLDIIKLEELRHLVSMPTIDLNIFP